MKTCAQITEELVALWEREYPEQSRNFPCFYNWCEQIVDVSKIKHHAPADEGKSMKYAGMMENGTKFPPLVLLGKSRSTIYELIDGFHRIWAYKKIGSLLIPAYVGIMK